MVKTLFGMTALVASAALIAWAALFMRQERETTRGLAYGYNVGGKTYYAFENDGNSSVRDHLVSMRNTWLSPDFRSRVCRRALAESANTPTNDIIKAISAAEIDIRSRKVSVLVRVKASSQDVADVCAKAFAREIIVATADQSSECKKKGVDQLKRNCEKQERYVTNLRERLCRLRTDNAEDCELSEAEGRLVSQERILAAMKTDVAKLQTEDFWCGFFVEMMDDGEATDITVRNSQSEKWHPW